MMGSIIVIMGVGLWLWRKSDDLILRYFCFGSPQGDWFFGDFFTKNIC